MVEKYAGSRALEVLRGRLGVETTLRETVVLVRSLPTILVRPNPRRLLLVFVNHGKVDVRIAPTNEMSWDYGVVISGNGGSLTLVLDEVLEAVTSAWYGTSTGVNCYVYVLEVVAQ